MGWKSFMVFPLKFAGARFVENRAVEFALRAKETPPRPEEEWTRWGFGVWVRT
jgi:hypothetical protein